MKNYTITVNGNVYDVVVEEGAARAATAYVPVQAAAPVATPAPVAVQAAAPVAAPVAAQASGAAGAIRIEAGAAGKIFKIEVSVGQAVLVLEAMKMEIPVVAPSDGVVASINVNSGDIVEAGGVLATLN